MNTKKLSSAARKASSTTTAKEAAPLPIMDDGLTVALACVRQGLYPPADLRYLFGALNLIKSIINLRITLAGCDLEDMQALQRAIDEIVLQKEVVGAHFPLAIKEMGDNPSQGICWDHPLYSIVLMPTTELAPQWTAMVATALPTLRVLHQRAQAIPDTFGSRNYNVGKALRQLAWAGGTPLSVLVDLPIDAKNVKDFLDALGTITELASIAQTSTDDFEQFYPLCRVLDWFNRGAPEWPKGVREGGGAGGGKQNREKPGGGKKRLHYDFVSLDGVDGADHSMADASTHVKGFSRFYSEVPMAERVQPKMDWALRDELPAKDFVFEVHVDRTLANYHSVRRAQAVRAARYGAQAMTLAAQRLPVSNVLLSGFEMRKLLKALENITSDLWRDVPTGQRELVAAYAGYRLTFSRSHRDATKVDAVRGSDVGQGNSWNVESDKFHLKVQSPSHAHPEFTEQTVPVCESFTLAAPLLLKRLFAPLRKRRGRLFNDACERHLSSLLTAINQEYETELTANKMQSWIARRMELLSGGDQVVSTYFTGKSPNDHMPAVYSSVAIQTLQNTFESAFWQLKEVTELDIAEPLQLALPVPIDDASPQVGTKHLVKTQVIKQTLVDLRTEIRLMYSTPGVGFADRHNIYTAYSMFIYLALTGTRPLMHFLPMVEAIDLTEGLAFTSEKDNEQYSYSRLVVLCEVLKNHLRHHSNHLLVLRSHLSLVNPTALTAIDAWMQLSDLTTINQPDRKGDLEKLAGLAHFFFFLDPKDGAVLAPNAETLQSHLGAEWKLRLYSLRHHFRTFLTRSAYHAESLDYAMGHMDARMQPLGIFSTMPTSFWSSSLAQEMEKLCADLGIEAMPSPLQPYSVSASTSKLSIA